MRETRLSADLPERYARLYDYRTGKFETPLDAQGIADVDQLFELAIWTYPDNMEDMLNAGQDVHHVYGTEADWKELAASYEPQDGYEISRFRNGTPQKAYVPRPLHEWVEYITEWPRVPSLDTMRRRNQAWRIANILLENVTRLDEARDEYDRKKHTTRWVLGNIVGITPVSKKSPNEIEERTNAEYLLSELTDRLDSWRGIADIANVVPKADRIIPKARLGDVRALRRQISRNGALIPLVTVDFAA